MSRTLRVSVPCNPAKLHGALEAAGLPVTTVRASWAGDNDPVALHAVIVFDESVDLVGKAVQIQAVIDAHLNDPAVKGKATSALPVGLDQAASLAKMELM